MGWKTIAGGVGGFFIGGPAGALVGAGVGAAWDANDAALATSAPAASAIAPAIGVIAAPIVSTTSTDSSTSTDIGPDVTTLSMGIPAASNTDAEAPPSYEYDTGIAPGPPLRVARLRPTINPAVMPQQLNGYGGVLIARGGAVKALGAFGDGTAADGVSPAHMWVTTVFWGVGLYLAARSTIFRSR